MITADKNWVHPVAIKNLDEAGFKKILKENLTPARAISTPEHLKGRAQNLKQIDRAFNSPGKHIFIYGDRGVGKTSLALTAAFLHQSADGEPILLTCGATPFLQTIRDAVRRVLPPGGRINQKTTESRFKAAIGNVGYDRAFNITNGDVPPIETINDAVQLLKFAGEVHSSEPVIIFDEFDQLIDDDQKKCCAEIIKQVSDQGLNVRFIFCGIGNSLENLIGVHLSTGRYLSPIQLERLSHDARWEIIKAASEALGVNVNHGHLVRIGQISDGFPSYIHLIGEQLFWSMFDDEEYANFCLQKHFEIGVSQAVSEAETTLKIIYENAVQKYSDDYEEVLWAVADHQLLRRRTRDIYEKSYLRIMEERHPREPLERHSFSVRLNALKSQRHGSILVGTRAGWYEFRENIVRGYVRLRAEKEGIQLGVEGYA
jgi:hypothetical protein